MSKYNIIIKNGRIWNGTKFLENVDTIAINDGLIADIGNITDDAEFIFDAKGSIISSGLVDIHTHIKGVSCEMFGVPIEAVCYPNGVTTVVEGCAENLNGKAYLDNMWLESYVFIATNIENNTFDSSKVDAILDAYQDRVLGLKVFFDTSSPEVKSIKPLTEICDYAHKKGLRVLVHSTGSPVPMDVLLSCLDKGDICTHIFHGGKNNASEDNFKCLENARKRGVILDNGMAGGVHTDFKVAKMAIEAGILPDTISTDITRASAFVRGGNYGLTMCMSIMRALGMSETDVLKCVTSSAAKVIGRDNACQKLEIGKRADICVLDYTSNPFDIWSRWSENAKGDKGYKNLLTVVGGKVMFRR